MIGKYADNIVEPFWIFGRNKFFESTFLQIPMYSSSYGKLILGRLMSLIKSSDALFQIQYNYRKGRSSMDALRIVITKSETYFNNRKYLIRIKEENKKLDMIKNIPQNFIKGLDI
ncbi:hypothetical protein V1478_005123 [Vespula squamosa]|uniref:Uncharacterized protein n=1 Tax=Vespula squamosa TaxID=30214 RepID=A0ABD2BDH1_VESSQ